MTGKIAMDNPIVEIDGDEMARVMWAWVKERLILPYVDLKTEYYDLHIKRRDETHDHVTIQAAESIKRWKVGVKCATITPNAERVKEYNLKKEWKSPNATIRSALDGTIFRAPIILSNVQPAVRFWKKPIVVARHAFGDIYDGVGLRFEGPAECEVMIRQHDGREVKAKFPSFKCSGVLQGIYNLDSSIESFARASFMYALENRLDLWFAAKDTISKVYDGRFKEIFSRIYREEFNEKFTEAGLNYHYYLIDDAVARAVRSEGGFVWACKNFDGDVLSDFVAAAYVGSLALMTSALFSPEGHFLSEAAHGTVQKHYYKHLKGEKTSTNPTAIIFAWTAALRRRGELDGNSALVEFACKLENAVRLTIERDRVMTADVANVSEPPVHAVVCTEDFIEAVKRNLNRLIDP
ncbi:MAG: NADP-dependent isocitrate dehydrogenase [Nitrososphaerota archaeon]|nr:NADP-dependent isocitrate dehydrogenase [Candidatus Bathyarchaeota archaeon]MDW8193672.1 NADP-dependent isocitrate dehydrogenase [Nitrososphaerota archaeon]